MLIALTSCAILCLIFAAACVLMYPQSRNLRTIKLIALAGLTESFFLVAIGTITNAVQIFTDRSVFHYQPSAPTFVLLSAASVAITIWLGFKLRRALKPGPPPPPPRGRQPAQILQLRPEKSAPNPDD